MTDDDRFLTVGELAARCRVAVSTVYHWHQTGQAPPFKRIGRRYLYDPTDVAEFVDRMANNGFSKPTSGYGHTEG